ncbi:hypothetical protein [Acidithiobacillus sp.]|uniref:hypothetical protein n=1 Tax=Acidithiobacillus sp. TaxID=1872118 RepID=UPI0025907458|nr:hypothetical protein [Acidithiobacillus sp.]MDD5374473.1 hypothetical protein [Acidithiobacillus sp.]
MSGPLPQNQQDLEAYWAAQANAAAEARKGNTEPDRQLQEDRKNGKYGPDVQKDYNDQVAGVEGTNVVTEEHKPAEYRDPGAASFGGFLGGAEYYKQHFLEGQKDNDFLQGQAKGAMDYGLGQMSGPNRHTATENGTLVNREATGRAGQQDALGLQMNAAMGGAPSMAQGQTTQAMNGLMGSRSSAMGGARGLSALNGAGLGGSATGAAAGNLAAQGGFGRSAEIGQEMSQYGSLAGNARGQDLGRLSQNSQNSNAYADLNDQWRLGQGQNAVNAGKLGNSLDLTDQQKYGASMQPAEAQLQADQAMQGIKQGAEADKSAIGYAKNLDKRKSDRDFYMTGATAGATAVGGPIAGGMVGIGGSYKP